MTQSEISDGKIHILYLVKNAPGVSYQMLMDKCLESLYLDFFNFSRCYNELISGNLLDKEVGDTGTGEVIGSNETIKITKGGEAILEDIESTLNLQTLGYLKKGPPKLRQKSEMNSVKAFAKPSSDGDGHTRSTLSTTKTAGIFLPVHSRYLRKKPTRILSNWRAQSRILSEDSLMNCSNQRQNKLLYLYKYQIGHLNPRSL